MLKILIIWFNYWIVGSTNQGLTSGFDVSPFYAYFNIFTKNFYYLDSL